MKSVYDFLEVIKQSFEFCVVTTRRSVTDFQCLVILYPYTGWHFSQGGRICLCIVLWNALVQLYAVVEYSLCSLEAQETESNVFQD